MLITRSFSHINLKTAQYETKVAAHLRSFFEKVGSFVQLFIVYISAHTFPRYMLRLRSLYIDSQTIIFRPSCMPYLIQATDLLMTRELCYGEICQL